MTLTFDIGAWLFRPGAQKIPIDCLPQNLFFNNILFIYQWTAQQSVVNFEHEKKTRI